MSNIFTITTNFLDTHFLFPFHNTPPEKKRKSFYSIFQESETIKYCRNCLKNKPHKTKKNTNLRYMKWITKWMNCRWWYQKQNLHKYVNWLYAITIEWNYRYYCLHGIYRLTELTVAVQNTVYVIKNSFHFHINVYWYFIEEGRINCFQLNKWSLFSS